MLTSSQEDEIAELEKQSRELYHKAYCLQSVSGSGEPLDLVKKLRRHAAELQERAGELRERYLRQSASSA